MLTGHLRPNRCSIRRERLPLLRCPVPEAVIPQWFSVQRFLYIKHYTFWITKSTFVENKLHRTQLKEYKLCISLGLGLKNSRNSLVLLCFHQNPVAHVHTEASLTLHSKYTSQFECELSKACWKSKLILMKTSISPSVLNTMVIRKTVLVFTCCFVLCFLFDCLF